jgi:transposase
MNKATKKQREAYNTKNKNILKEKIQANQHNLWLPDVDAEYKNIVTNSCYDMKITSDNEHIEAEDDDDNELPFVDEFQKVVNVLTKCQKVTMYPTTRQKHILQIWFDACTEMYNATVKHIKKTVDFKKLPILRNLFALVHDKFPKKGKYVIQLDNLKKKITGLQTNMKRDLKFINTERARTTANKNKYNTKMKYYVNTKNTLRQTKIEMNNLKYTFLAAKKQYDEICAEIKSHIKYTDLRTYILKDLRNEISKRYIYNNDQKTIIVMHALDCAIKHACTAFKSAFTNYIEGNIGGFKVKYWKRNRKKKVMEFDSVYTVKGSVCKTILGKIPMKYCQSGKWIDYDIDNPTSVKVHYDEKTDAYTLLVSISFRSRRNNAEENSFIGIDPGIRKFMTCITKNRAIKFGTKISIEIRSLLKEIDKINRNKYLDLSEDEKKERCAAINKRIRNIVDELHWKVINYLTENYDRIYIGKLNMQSVVASAQIRKMTKRIGLALRHYEFRQRLVYKCQAKRIMCIQVDERFTSKTCSVCGEYKHNLGDAEIYNCNHCGSRIDRDISGARSITLKKTKVTA